MVGDGGAKPSSRKGAELAMEAVSEQARKRAHARLDQFFDIALKERLWGDVIVKARIEDGAIVRVGFAPDLGEKF